VIITTYDNKENLASKMLLSKALAQSTERRMRSFFINKNLSIDCRLKMRIRKKGIFEKVILVFGREQE
jgi:hypothetical protein